ncbi:MFS transporter [Actinocatenispora thailandica]|uniref:MFS transporter n=1 Tax=Actinocatenispora thailandica TaxID=227318 RepID=A0A7R7DVM0_9ACTN|nr:MFS transporter [Actinocatenispora thailandica]BCJ38695.1 MFS transporter [Actinocatenispora thailandica]
MSTSPRAGGATPVPPGRAGGRLLALVVLCAGQLMVILDGTIVNVALPTISDALDFTPANLAWVMNAYLIGFGGLLPLAGRIGDLIGRKRVFVTGLVAFVAASALCAAAVDQAMLIAARFIQGAGGALASAVVLGMLVTLYERPGDRARAIGAFTFVGSGGASIGTIAGGVLTQTVGWHWIFLVNLPIGLAAAALAIRVLPAERGLGLRAGADAAGAVLVTAGLMLGVYTIVRSTEQPWPYTLGTAAGAVVLLAGFVLRQARARTPLLPLRVFAVRSVAGGNAVQLLMIAGMFGFQFLVALYLREVLGYDPLHTGLALLPASLTIAVVSLGVSGRLVARFGPVRMLAAGLATVVLGFAILAQLPSQHGYPVLLPALIVLGAGFATAMPALTGLAMSGGDPADSGVVSGLFNTVQQIAGALGLAVLSTVAAAHTRQLVAAGTGAAAAQTAGYRVAFVVAGGLVLAALALGVTLLRRTGAPARPAAPVTVDRAEPAGTGRS